MQSWWKALDSWLWKWNQFSHKRCVKFTLNTARQCKIAAPLNMCTLLPSEEVWAVYEPLLAQPHSYGQGSGGRARPTRCTCSASRHCLARQELNVTTHFYVQFISLCGLLAGTLSITSWKGSCQGRGYLIFWAHQLLDRSPQAALRRLLRYILHLSNVISPLPLHCARWVSEWPTI